MKIYIINLARNSDRLRSMTQQLDACGLAFERSEARDGYDMTKAELEKAQADRPLAVWNTPGHIGCLFSHAHVWQRIAEGADSHACIMEDDVHIAPIFPKLLRRAQDFPRDFDLIRLEYSPGRVLLDRQPVFSEAGTGLYRLRSSSWGTAAYIITRACARKLTAIPIRDHTFVDYLLFDYDESPLAKIFRTYQFSPAVAVQDKFVPDAARLHFHSNLGEDYVQPPLPKAWQAFRNGNYGYLWRTLRGYKPLEYIL